MNMKLINDLQDAEIFEFHSKLGILDIPENCSVYPDYKYKQYCIDIHKNGKLWISCYDDSIDLVIQKALKIIGCYEK